MAQACLAERTNEKSVRPDRRPLSSTRSRGFSLIELMVVLAVTMLLASILFPALGGVRETANRMACASNQRQIGLGITMWADDHNGNLPASYFGSKEAWQPQEMMAATVGEKPADWEGLGWLVSGHYLDSPACLYCPSHSGEHSFDRYRDDLAHPITPTRIYLNYHYAGDRDPALDVKRRMMNDHKEILVTDGLRTKSDFNHGHGLNLLHGDGAVIWLEDVGNAIRTKLPDGVLGASDQVEKYEAIWGIIDDTSK